jgi:hypothetical protein
MRAALRRQGGPRSLSIFLPIHVHAAALSELSPNSHDRLKAHIPPAPRENGAILSGPVCTALADDKNLSPTLDFVLPAPDALGLAPH